VNINERRDELIKQLRNKEYRDAFVNASINVGVPSQIWALREQKEREWSQKELGDKAGMAQESISRIEDPSRGSVSNLKTLLRLASAFDVGLIVRFVPFSQLVEWKLKLSLEALEAESFDKEPYFQEKENKTFLVDDYQQYTTIPTAEAAKKEILPSRKAEIASPVDSPSSIALAA
jgi:transcriptional regulator with XRE-family HTH domain